ncbi:MAG: Na+/H+ antiporter subunit E [Dictyoglomi bacterium]|nr:Na+/H+ antiporter subunit E [Dictyoglomota bacterium]
MLLIWYIMGGRSGEDLVIGFILSIGISWILEKRDIHSHLGDISRTLQRYPISLIKGIYESIVLTIGFTDKLKRKVIHRQVHTKDVFSQTINITATPMSIVFDYDSKSGELYIHEVHKR